MHTWLEKGRDDVFLFICTFFFLHSHDLSVAIVGRHGMAGRFERVALLDFLRSWHGKEWVRDRGDLYIQIRRIRSRELNISSTLEQCGVSCSSSHSLLKVFQRHLRSISAPVYLPALGRGPLVSISPQFTKSDTMWEIKYVEFTDRLRGPVISSYF